LQYTLDLYRQRGWRWFGGGSDLDNARQPVLIEHNGNRIAFLGCNEAGPPGDWATKDRPGSNPCGADRMTGEIQTLRSQGYLPIFTFQWHEHYTPVPPENQREAFRAAADAGAIAVSGSQAHQPQGFEFRQGAFIHYGLGNLFFDQEWSTQVRQEFIDRYVFYDGRLISVELLTAFLEDWSRPRPMTPQERAAFLQDIFTASGW
jgi:poly-gamma-glutamate synthesis protein (capsule biosynthesis protein)